jgi:glycosyltransferase involved in cell wall biosynthesis
LDIYWHHRFTNNCAKDSVFVCNSPSSIADLDHVAPGAGSRAVIIPCAIQTLVPLKYNIDITDILSKRMSLAATASPTASSSAPAPASPGGTQRPPALRQFIEKELKSTRDLRYIISVSSLEPRKNFINAIGAWERVRAITGEDLKFVIVANQGWRQDDIFAVMRPHVMAGNLIHVEQLPSNELQALYKNAELCLFPSYAEGFGYAPLEALQTEIPVVVSDLPVFRWSLEDAALFADPYDVDALTDATLRLIKTPENEPLRLQMLENSRRVLRRFAVATVAEQWKQFFEDDIHRLFQNGFPDDPKR